MRFCGIDLHSNNSVVVVTDETDKVLVSRRCPNDLSKILALLAPHRDELSGVVVESTYNWYWLVDGLMSEGYAVKLANTVAMKRYDGLKHSDNEADAAHLAHLLRLGILPTGYIHPPAERALRDLARKRIQLVRDRTRHVLAVQNILARQTGGCVSSNVIKRHQALDCRGRGRSGAGNGCLPGRAIERCRHCCAESGNRADRGTSARRREAAPGLCATQK